MRAAMLLLSVTLTSLHLAVALSLDETQDTSTVDASASSSQATERPRDGIKRTAELLVGTCSVAAAAAGSALCASAGPVVGGGYLAAGASGLAAAMAMRRARCADNAALTAQRLEQEQRAIAETAVEMRAELEYLRKAVDGVRKSGEHFSTSLWRAVQGRKNDNLAASLERSERIELLTLLQALNNDRSGAPLSAAELQEAEHYVLRTIPQRSLQSLILAASRASVAVGRLGAGGANDADHDGARKDRGDAEAKLLPGSRDS